MRTNLSKYKSKNISGFHKVAVNNLWAQKMIGTDKAKLINKGEGALIFILDDGLPTHSELNHKIIDAWNFTNESVVSKGGHAFGVSGIILSDKYGVATGSRAIQVKVLNKKGRGKIKWTVAALRKVIDYQTGLRKIVNISLGAEGYSHELKDVLEEANQKQIIINCSAGNQGNTGKGLLYPAKYPTTISWGACDKDLNIPKSSARAIRDELDLVAPGVNIISASINNYQLFTGNSFSCAFGTGVTALMVTANPTLTPEQVKQLLHLTALDMTYVRGYDRESGFGLVQAEKAVKSAEMSLNQFRNNKCPYCGKQII